MRYGYCKLVGRLYHQRVVPVLFAVFVLGAHPLPSAAQAGTPVYNPANGHYYQEVAVPGGLTWDQANAGAQSMSYMGIPGHLLTITSAAENQFVFDNLPNGINGHWFIGGYQDLTAPDYSEPAGGWRWVTGEPFVYTNWQDNEPNNADGDDKMQILNNGKWNDLPSSTNYLYGGYLVEYTIRIVSLLEIIPNPVAGNKMSTGQVTLGDPAGPGGVLITLSSDNPDVAAPTTSSLLIPQGGTAATFKIKTRKVSTATNVTISATANGIPKNKVLTVTP